MEQSEPTLGPDLAILWNIQADKTSWVSEVKVDNKVRGDIVMNIQAVPDNHFFYLQIVWRHPTEGALAEVWSRVALFCDSVQTLMFTASLWTIQIILGAISPSIENSPSHAVVMRPGLRQALDDFFAKLVDKGDSCQTS